MAPCGAAATTAASSASRHAEAPPFSSLKVKPSMASACPGLISGTFQVSTRESGAGSISHVLSARLGKTALFSKLGPSTLAVCAGTLRLAKSAGRASVADISSTNSVFGFCHFTRVALPSRYSGRSRSKLLQPWKGSQPETCCNQHQSQAGQGRHGQRSPGAPHTQLQQHQIAQQQPDANDVDNLQRRIGKSVCSDGGKGQGVDGLHSVFSGLRGNGPLRSDMSQFCPSSSKTSCSEFVLFYFPKAVIYGWLQLAHSSTKLKRLGLRAASSAQVNTAATSVRYRLHP